MALDFSTELDYASKELTRIRRELAYADTIVLAVSAQTRDTSALIRAYSYVWLSGTLEKVVGDSLRSVTRELNSLALPLKDVKTCLLSMACDPQINSITSKHPNPSWEKRVELIDKLISEAPTFFPEDSIPLDGKTLRGEHFEIIWKVFGLSGKSLPAPQHKLALKDLAEGRNKVAHGNIDPITFGKSKAISDVSSLCRKVDEIIINIISELDNFLNKKLYLR